MANKKSGAEGVTAASGTVSGAIIGGGLGGPAGAAVGAVIGAAAGAMVGYSLARALVPAEEDAYWRSTFHSRPYVKPGSSYADYRDAYRYGWESAARDERAFDQAASDIEREWNADRDGSTLSWDDARDAVRDGFLHAKHGTVFRFD